MARVAPWVVLLAALVAWVRVLVGFFNVLPGHDFVGDLYWAEFFHDALAKGTLPSWWTRMDGLGHPTTVQYSSIMLFLPVALLKTACGDTVLAAKMWFAALHTLSFGAAYSLARTYRVSRWAAVLGALAYGFAPLHLYEVRATGHWQLAVSFCLSPLIVAAALRSARSRSRKATALLAVLVTWCVLADNERTVTLIPVLLLWVAVDAHARASGAGGSRSAGTSVIRALARCGLALAVGALLSAPFTLPLLLERGDLALLQSPTLFASHAAQSVYHPFFLLDGGNWLYPDPSKRPAHAGGLHGGWLLLGTSCVGIGLAKFSRWRRRDGTASPLTRHAAGLGVVLLATAWLTTGPLSWASSTIHLYAQRWFGGLVLLAALVLVGSWILRATREARPRGSNLALSLACLAVAVLVPASLVLSHVPLLSEIKNPRWFSVVNLPLLGSVLVALVADACFSARADARLRPAVGLVAVMFVLLDLVSTPSTQSAFPASEAEDARSAAGALASDRSTARYLPYPYVESDAREAFALRFSTRPSASSWLLWSCSRWGATRVERAYASLAETERLAASDRLTRDLAEATLDDLADLDIEYLVVSSSSLAVRYFEGQNLVRAQPSPASRRVFRNLRWTEGALVRRVTSSSARDVAVAYTRTSDERWSIDADSGGTYVVAEAWYPFWHARTRGREIPTRAIDGLLGFDVDVGADAKPVELTYERPRYYPFFGALAVLAAMALGAWAFSGRRTLS